MENGHTREVLETARNQVEIIAHSAQAGIRVKSRKYWVLVTIGHETHLNPSSGRDLGWEEKWETTFG